MARPELFRVRRAGGNGVLATMAHPRGGAWLDEEIAGLANEGIGTLASLLPDAEQAELGLTGEADAAARAGLGFRRLPVPDLHVPDRAACLALAEELRGRLASGGGVAIHCRAGIGRSSVLAAAVLVLEGTRPERAWQLISDARGVRVPDTDAQRDFILGLPGSR